MDSSFDPPSSLSADACPCKAELDPARYGGAPAPLAEDQAFRPSLNLKEALEPGGLIKAAIASPAIFKFVLSFLDDTGAGRFITSKKELERQGVPKHVLGTRLSKKRLCQ